jgi:hypothetical protein
MNGVVFHTSTRMAAISRSVRSESIGSLMMPIVLATYWIIPIRSWNIRRHITAEMTVGNAHGTRMAALTSPRPLKALFTASAMLRPSMNSSVTLTTVKITVLESPSKKSGSWNIST